MNESAIEKPPGLSPAVRRFTLLDGMVLIAAFALCLAVPGAFKALLIPVVWEVFDAHRYLRMIFGAYLLIASTALGLLTVFIPNPEGRQRFRQPGTLAMVLVPMAWAFDAIQTAVGEVMRRSSSGNWTAHNLLFSLVFEPVWDVTFRAGLAILSGWLTLALLGVVRPSKSWLDRTGRILGWSWVV